MFIYRLLGKIRNLKRINQIEPSMDESEKKELLSVIDSGWFTEAAKLNNLNKCLPVLQVLNLHVQ